MAFFKIEVDDRILKVSEWGTFIPPVTARLPRMYRIEDGAYKIYFNSSYNTWVSRDTVFNIEPDVPEKIESAPNPQFSEDFILKLVAISKDSSLARDLTK